MDGSTLKAGAVCGVTHIRNPIELARTVMEHSEYVMLSGAGAEEFALSRGFALVPQQLFSHPGALAAARTHPRRRRRVVGADHLPRGYGGRGRAGRRRPAGRGHVHRRHDRKALSTASAIRPSSARAPTRTTAPAPCRRPGHGEIFIRAAVAHDICARMRFGGRTLAHGGARSGARGTPGTARRRRRHRHRPRTARSPWNSIRKGCFAPAEEPAKKRESRSTGPDAQGARRCGYASASRRRAARAASRSGRFSRCGIRLPSPPPDFCPVPWRCTALRRRAGSIRRACGCRSAG